jgi:triacylglycerol esterase/lipase EstA (alpha/beta hydrolase family)
MANDGTAAEPLPDRILVVLVHGYVHTPDDMRGVESAVREAWPNATVLVPPLPTRRYSRADANELVIRVVSEIDREWRQGSGDESPSPYRGIVLVGHSLGALIARKAYLVACGEQPRAPFEDALRKALSVSAGERFEGFTWSGAVERIVLLAAMNRGCTSRTT